MMIHINKRGGSGSLICEQCDAVMPLPRHVPIIDVWRDHARGCKGRCPMPIATATHLKVSRLPSA